MAKINEDAFNQVISTAPLKESTNDDEVQRYIMVYDVPKSWIKVLKNNKLKASQYFKQAVLEKLQRDNML